MKLKLDCDSLSQKNQYTTDLEEAGAPMGPRPSGLFMLPYSLRLRAKSGDIAKKLQHWMANVFSPGEVWGPPLLKLLGGASLLLGVAYLGHISRQLEDYGPLRVLDQRVIGFVERIQSTPQPVQTFAGASAVDSSTVISAESAASLLSQTHHSAKKPDCPQASVAAETGILPDGRVILNEATAAELTTLPGIGNARATAIVQLRERLKHFKKLEDLLRIRGIGWKSLSKLKPKLVLERPVSSTPNSESPVVSTPGIDEVKDGRSGSARPVEDGDHQKKTDKIVASMGLGPS